MNGKSFIDTNVLVYAYDKGQPEKQATAQNILTDSIKEDSAVLSVQVFSEFFNVVTKRINDPMPPDAARGVIEALSILTVLEIDYPMVIRAIDTHQKYRISYWDALIVAAAERAGAGFILSEDLNSGQIYNGVTIQNPFEADKA